MWCSSHTAIFLRNLIWPSLAFLQCGLALSFVGIKISVQAWFSTPDQWNGGSPCHMTRSANHVRHSVVILGSRKTYLGQDIYAHKTFCSLRIKGGGPRVVVSTAAFHARVRGSVPGLGGLKETKMFLPHPRVRVSIVGNLRDREVACSASDRQGSNFESFVWRTVSSQSSHHPQEVLLAQFSLYVHKGGLKPDSFHFIAYKS